MAAGDVTIVREDVHGEEFVRIVTVELPSSYATGGQAVNTAKFGLTTIDFIDFEPTVKDADEIFFPHYDRAADKVMVFGADGAAAGIAALKEMANATSLTGLLARARVIGKR